METMTRKEARSRGLRKYFTGVPCKHGHLVPRRMASGCVECNRIANQTPQQKARRKVARLRPHRQITERRALREYNQRPEVRKKRTIYCRERAREKLPVPTRPCPSVCELCGGPPGEVALHLDHDHATGVFRGWLCRHCNLGLGNFQDSVVRLFCAMNYLSRGVNG